MQHYTFYDFIVNKARGKSGPLFSFDVHEDVRMISDASVEKDEVCFDENQVFHSEHYKFNTKLITPHRTGAPDENVVQNHLNIALLNVF